MDVKEVMKNYFLELDAASKSHSKKIAWCTSAGPAEIARAMGFEVFFPENHGAMLGASRVCMETIPRANAHGYSPDICSYLTSDIGAFLKKMTPLTSAYGIDKVPHPDVLIYHTNQCKDVMHWFEFYGRQFKAPVFGIHAPTHLPTVEKSHREDVASQFQDLAAKLSKISGVKVQDTKISETLDLSRQATALWSEVLAKAKHKPSPINFFDATIYMGPIVVLRGTPVAVDFYRALLKQLDGLIAKGVASVPGETVRIYWEGMPIWGRLRALAELFKKNKACVVASTYCNSWIFDDFKPSDPWKSMAEAYLSIFINRNDGFKQGYIEKMVRDYAVDGVLFHDAKTCPNNSNSQYNLPGRLREKGIASVVINGDLCDLRCFSDEQAVTIIEAFLETLA